MGIADAAQRKEKSKKEFYQTPYKATLALLKMWDISLDITILDPCEGKGAITKILKMKGFSNVTGIDRYPVLPETFGYDFLKYKKRHEVIIGNSPYSLKNEFITHGLSIADDVFYILPMQVVNYNFFHRNFLNIPEYQGRLLMTPKFIMSSNIHADWSLDRGGISAYAWFHWSNDRYNKFSSYEKYIDLGGITYV